MTPRRSYECGKICGSIDRDIEALTRIISALEDYPLSRITPIERDALAEAKAHLESAIQLIQGVATK